MRPAEPAAYEGPALHDLLPAPADGPAAELAASLSSTQASIAPKFFYDPLGSAVFAAICALPEYYPTRTERAILQAHGEAIARAAGRGCTLVDLGAGDCRKAESLFPLLAPAQYVAVDVSGDYLRESVGALAQRHRGIDMVGVAADFSAGLELPSSVGRRRLFFYPGSSIGNFEPAAAGTFLAGLRAAMDDDGGLLLGVDLVKPEPVLQAAYDDALGLTAAFNRNALLAANRLLGADFDPHGWDHVALWNAQASRIEMHLQARGAVRVRWPGGERAFAAGERIHTENSYKYTPDAIERLLAAAGLRCTHRWLDPQGWFAVLLARPQKRS